MKKKLPKYLLGVVFIGLGAIICLPVLLLVSGSLADSLEWRQRAGGYLQDTREYIAWRWIPAYPTLEHYKRLLFFSPAFRSEEHTSELQSSCWGSWRWPCRRRGPLRYIGSEAGMCCFPCM